MIELFRKLFTQTESLRRVQFEAAVKMMQAVIGIKEVRVVQKCRKISNDKEVQTALGKRQAVHKSLKRLPSSTK